MTKTKLQKRNEVRAMIKVAKESGDLSALNAAIKMIEDQTSNKKAIELIEKINALLPKEEPQIKFMVVRTQSGEKTHLATIHPDSTNRFVSCGVIKNAGTKLIDVTDNIEAENITCEKCRAKHDIK